MKRTAFYLALTFWILFEILNVYFIMPMPGSQRMNSIDIAYFLYQWRWVFRMVFFGVLLYGISSAVRGKKWILILSILMLAGVLYIFNGPMTASSMFRPISRKVFLTTDRNNVPLDKLVIGLQINGEARAYPIQIIGYHHRVLDTVGGRPVMVTYCTVCRTGRVYDPTVNGKTELFRLVGMDHFNAMFEDQTTGSWWRQATGVYCAGPLKGQMLAQISSVQMSLSDWFRDNPDGKVLQYDPKYSQKYKSMNPFEYGKSKSHLTKRDYQSWQEKSWILGIQGKSVSHVYDWNELEKNGYMLDTIDGKILLILLHPDRAGFSSWFVPQFSVNGNKAIYHSQDNSLEMGNFRFFINGNFLDMKRRETKPLDLAPVFQEYWHSWQTFRSPCIRRSGKYIK